MKTIAFSTLLVFQRREDEPDKACFTPIPQRQHLFAYLWGLYGAGNTTVGRFSATFYCWVGR